MYYVLLQSTCFGATLRIDLYMWYKATTFLLNHQHNWSPHAVAFVYSRQSHSRDSKVPGAVAQKPALLCSSTPTLRIAAVIGCLWIGLCLDSGNYYYFSHIQVPKGKLALNPSQLFLW